MDNCKVTVVLPLSRDSAAMKDTIASLLAQTCREIEILIPPCDLPLVDLPQDSRIHLLDDSCSGGDAANLALKNAKGTYLLVLQSGDTLARDLIQRVLDRAAGADIAVFCGYTRSRVGNPKPDDADGYDPKLIRDGNATLSRSDFESCRYSVCGGGLSFRMTRTAFLRENNITFPSLATEWELPFCALCDEKAESIALMDRRMLTAPAPMESYFHWDVLGAAAWMAENLSNRPAAARRILELTAQAFRRSTVDLGTSMAQSLYAGLQELYASPVFESFTATEKDLCFFRLVRDTSYEEVLQRSRVPLVVSFTSFPKRIGYTVNVIENVARQTRKADKVLLYLAPTQFPNREDDLPPALLEQVKKGMVELRWVRDIRSHKKYHYVMQEFPDSAIVTLDDDLVYPDDMLENLYHCYLCHPDKVSAMRAHLTVVDEAGGLILGYNRWVKEYRGATYLPSPQLFVTSGAGTLFPPRVLHPLALDLDTAWNLCPHADDVWLNMMTLLNDRCVVLAVDDFTMKNMPGSQEEALQTINVDENQNDVQYDRIRQFLTRQTGRDVIWEALISGNPAVRCRTVLELSDQYLALDDERKRIQAKLHKVWADKVAREQDIAKLRQELAEERRSFPLLRVLSSLRRRGIKQTLSVITGKIRRKLGK